MKQFIPLEDDWSLIEALTEQRLVPYRPGMCCQHAAMERGDDSSAQGSSSRENFFAPPSQLRRAAL